MDFKYIISKCQKTGQQIIPLNITHRNRNLNGLWIDFSCCFPEYIKQG